jgi:tetratricopeptide (TPR) repeat protein
MRLMRHLFSAAYPIDEWQAECANSAVLEYQHPRWQFAHDRVRNLILQRLDPEQRREMHGAVARAIETTYADLTDHEASLAYHWGEFGDLALELHYSLLTAARALPSGVYQEVLKRCERVQAIIGQLPAVEDAVIVRVRSMIGEACLGLGRYSEARQNFETNLTHARVTSDLALMAASSSRLGDIDYVLGDFAAARERHEAAVRDFRDAGDQDGVARSLDALGNIAYELGDDVLATRLFQESLSIRRSLGKSWGMAGSATGETAAVHET